MWVFAGFSGAAPSAPVVEEYQEAQAEAESEEINIEEDIEISSSSHIRDLITFNIFEDIGRAKALLREQRCGFQIVRATKTVKVKGRRGKVKYRKVALKPQLGEFTILVAILNVKNRSIRILRVHPRLGLRADGVLVEPGKSNGVNTKFTIVYPEHQSCLP